MPPYLTWLKCVFGGAIRLGLLLGLCAAGLQAVGQVRALNAEGDTVLLYTDGRRFLLPRTDVTGVAPTTFGTNGAAIPPALMARKSRPLTVTENVNTNPFPYRRPEQARYLIPHAGGDFQAWFDPQVWLPIDPAEINSSAVAVFQYLRGQAIAILVHEPTEVDLRALTKAAFESTQEVAADVRLGVQEYRDVNDRFVLCVRMEGVTTDQIYTYYSYYYSGQGFSLQFTVYTPRDVFLLQQEDFQGLLNGLIIR